MATPVVNKKIKFLLILLALTLSISYLSWTHVPIFADSDKDGVMDSIDNCPTDANSDQMNFDLDQFGDACDTDDDNDGVDDILDQFDSDPHDWADYDFDGIGANMDPDDDNDGIQDQQDDTSIPVTEDMTQKHLEEIQGCAIIASGTSRLLCYGDFFDHLVSDTKDNSQTVELAYTLSKIGALDDCHFVSHEIGHVAYEKNPNVISLLDGMDSSVCRGGFYHGVMSAYFHDIKENKKQVPEYKTLCDDFIGRADYQDCIHGLGHGFVHYYLEDIKSSIDACHSMSFYQASLCIGGVMMQYTDSELTTSNSWEQDIPTMCSKINPSQIDYHQCNVSLGLSLAYHTDHNRQVGTQFCNLITDENGRDACLIGVIGEINDAKKYIEKPLSNDVREKFQPQWILDNSVAIDILSPAIISDFNYIQGAGLMTFSFDRPGYIIMYIPEGIFTKAIITVNGQIDKDMVVENNFMGEDITKIRLIAEASGQVMINAI